MQRQRFRSSVFLLTTGGAKDYMEWPTPDRQRFSAAIGMAASFDPALLHREAGIMATEFGRSSMRSYARKATAAGSTASPSGLLTSISFATRARAGARKLTAKIRS